MLRAVEPFCWTSSRRQLPHGLVVAAHGTILHILCCAMQNPDTQPQAPIDPEVLAAAEANMPQDSVRYMADKLNQAVGGE